nr:MAG TPA: hypothetical protein [Caudoviricetes sp.]
MSPHERTSASKIQNLVPRRRFYCFLVCLY